MSGKNFTRVLLVLSILLFPLSFGCQGKDDPVEALHGLSIPTTITFGNKTYKSTADVVAIESVPQNLYFVGKTSLDGTKYINSDNINDEGFVIEMYSIEGIDIGEAIAVKQLLVGKNGAYNYYMKYERK